MPDKSKEEEMYRQYEMLLLLPSEPPGMTTKEIVEQLGNLDDEYVVDIRTIQRDLMKLKDRFALAISSEKKPYRWYWPGAGRARLAGLSIPEALSLRLIEQTVRDLIPESVLHVLKPRFEQAERQLQKVAGRTNKTRWLDRVASIPRNLVLVAPQQSTEILGTVQEALIEDKELEIKYKSLQDKSPAYRTVHPRALLQKGSVTYLIANKVNESDPRMYAVHRISEAYRTDRPVSRSPFNLKNYLAEQAHEVGTGEWLDLELWVNTNLAKILRETPLAKGQTLTEASDGARVQARVKDTLPLRQWIRGHGPAVEVLGPASLRQTMAADLRAAADRYDKPVRRKRS